MQRLVALYADSASWTALRKAAMRQPVGWEVSARAYAALSGARKVKREHMLAVAPMALRHRLRRDVLDETGSTVRIERAVEELFG